VIDSREPEGMCALLQDVGLTVAKKRLWAGDYEVGDRAIVERKTVRGLHLAIVNGDFWPQVGRVRNVARFAYLVIEGRRLDAGPLTPAAVRGICIAVMDLGVHVIRTDDLNDTARWLQRLAERRAAKRFRSRPAYAQRPQPHADGFAARAALAAVPGISDRTAEVLLDRFGSLAAVVNATPSEWEKVRGVGPKRSRAMTLTFHTVTTASGSRLRREPQGRAT
jgi:ERCC4-type nuclease